METIAHIGSHRMMRLEDATLQSRMDRLAPYTQGRNANTKAGKTIALEVARFTMTIEGLDAIPEGQSGSVRIPTAALEALGRAEACLAATPRTHLHTCAAHGCQVQIPTRDTYCPTCEHDR